MVAGISNLFTLKNKIKGENKNGRKICRKESNSKS